MHSSDFSPVSTPAKWLSNSKPYRLRRRLGPSRLLARLSAAQERQNQWGDLFRVVHPGRVNHMDETLDLGASLAHVQAAPTGAELLERAMRLNTIFWRTVCPVAQVLVAAKNDDEALGAAWRDRMKFRQMAFG